MPLRAPANPPLPVYDVYIDESSQTKHRFLTLGAIVTRSSDVSTLEAAIIEARRPELPAGEMKWGKVSAAKAAAYKRVIDLFFLSPHAPLVHFHCLVLD